MQASVGWKWRAVASRLRTGCSTCKSLLREAISMRQHLPITKFGGMWIPQAYRQHATFYTDQYVVYEKVIPAAQHKAISKLARKTNHIERFNNTLRQRVSRLVRDALSFSKKLANHIGAIKLFICHYNMARAAA